MAASSFAKSRSQSKQREPSMETRLHVLLFGFLCAAAALGVRLFQLQIIHGRTYQLLASDQHALEAALIPRRGSIYLQDAKDGKLYPVAEDADAWQIFARPKEMKDIAAERLTLATILQLPESSLLNKLSATSTSYAIIADDAPLTAIDALRAHPLPGIGMTKKLKRVYPEQGLGGQTLGFVSADDKQVRRGHYGVEGYYQDVLAGQPGTLVGEHDAFGRRLTIGGSDLQQAQDGASIVLTIDRALQYQACQKMQETAERFQATAASVVILDPDSGAILALCAAPDFDPAHYGDIHDVSVLNNPITFYAYEPGSVFKPVTMAAGIDTGKITPNSTYVDTGSETIDGFTIRNSDKKSHGTQTMTGVLDQSLNTGTIFVERQVGREVFRDYIRRFGFGQKTGIPVAPEARGNISGLDRAGKIFAATASFGQGISVTPLQMAIAYAALANGGKLVHPYLVREIIHPDGRHEAVEPQPALRIIDERTARLVSAMLIDVVEHGHGKHAAVPGYYVAGKTGTAQVPDLKSGGYLKDATIGSFAGYAPIDHPRFVMLVRVDRPKSVQFAESSAAPVFGELAKGILQELHVPPERPIVNPPPASVTPSAKRQPTTPNRQATSTQRDGYRL